MAESLKQRLHQGEDLKIAGSSIDASKSDLEATLSQDSYDLASIDSQHAAFNEDRLVSFCAMAAELGVPVQFRIKHTRHAFLIGNILDLGPLGIEIPIVEEEATVDEALEAFYYPQVGRRSWGGAARYGIEGRGDRLEYADCWNRTGILCLQMESVRAVTNVRKLAKPGVDCLTWGPNDLLYDLEAHPEHPFKSVDDCVRHALKQLQGADAKISFRSYLPENRNKYIDMGVTVLKESRKA